MKFVFLLTSGLLLLGGCGSGQGDEDSSASAADTTSSAEVGEDSRSCFGAPCSTVSDCPAPGACISQVACEAGCCQVTFEEPGTECNGPCQTGGLCTADGACEGAEPVTCPDQDGNPCTVPHCDSDTGECAPTENPMADGAAPFSTTCWQDLTCAGGEPAYDQATPTGHNLACQALDEALDPYGCIDQVVCVSSEDDCKEILKGQGQACWSGEQAQGATCAGHSCQGGECLPDSERNVTCQAGDLPGCDAPCQGCTAMTCHWIPDPASDVKKKAYCKPEALTGAACDDSDMCTAGDQCAAGSTGTGPLGKETLGTCQAGPELSKLDCLADMGKPDLACLNHGVSCIPDQGCVLDQEKADQWCWPPQTQCFDKAQTFCTHLDPGDGLWNAQNGCHIDWQTGLDCDDGDVCTADSCVMAQGQASCVHEPLTGTPCDDGDPCTQNDACVNGQCAGQALSCDDGNPCTADACDPLTQTCINTPFTPCCGNDVVEPPEECDDGNQVGDDGCSTDCKLQEEGFVVSAFGIDDFDVADDGSLAWTGRVGDKVYLGCADGDLAVLQSQLLVFESPGTVERAYVAIADQTKQVAVMFRYYTVPGDAMSRQGRVHFFDSDCNPVGDGVQFEIQYLDEWRDIDVDDDGDFTLVWSGTYKYGLPGQQDVTVVQTYTPTGQAKLGASLLTGGDCDYAVHVAIQGSGGGVVSCQGHSSDEVWFWRFDDQGSVQTEAVQVEGTPPSSWYDSHEVGIDDDGNVALLWTAYSSKEFKVNLYDASDNLVQTLTLDPAPDSCWDGYRDHRTEIQLWNGSFILPYYPSTEGYCYQNTCKRYSAVTPAGAVTDAQTVDWAMDTLRLDGGGNVYIRGLQGPSTQIAINPFSL